MIRTIKQCLWCKSKDLSLFARRRDGVGIITCANCGLYMVDKIPDNLDEYYYQEAYFTAGEANIDSGYGEIYDLMAPAFLFWQNSLIEVVNENHKLKHFLEVGCATGNLLEMIRESQPGLELEGIDLSEYAAAATRAKGIKAQAVPIEKYRANPKKDLIFSSETMEHLDDLRSFLEGIRANLNEDGVFLFYVPSISVADAEQDTNYVRFNTNLEHLLHFTPEFLEGALTEVFDATAFIQEFKTGFGPCIVGGVTKQSAQLSDLKQLCQALNNNHLPAVNSTTFLKDFAIISLKFAKFPLASAAIKELKKSDGFDETELMLLLALEHYHKGELIKSNERFQEYLQRSPGSKFAIRSLLANERELNKLYTQELADLRAQIAGLQAADAELQRLKQSKLVGAADKLRRGVHSVTDNAKHHRQGGHTR